MVLLREGVICSASAGGAKVLLPEALKKVLGLAFVGFGVTRLLISSRKYSSAAN